MARRGLALGEWGEVMVLRASGRSPYKARARFRGFDGRIRLVEKRGSSPRAARKALVAELEERARRVSSQLHGGTTFEEAAGMWLSRLERLAEMGQRSPGTVQTYRFQLGRHVLPRLGGLRLQEITTPLLDRFVMDLDQDVGSATARTCRSIISGTLGMAVRQGAIRANPTRDLERLEGRIAEVADNLTLIEQNGRPIARISMAPAPPAVTDGADILSASACVVIGGLRAGNDLGGVAGIVLGTPTKADRLGFRLDYRPDAWAAWATDQAARWGASVNLAIARGGYTEVDQLARLTVRLRGDPGGLFICRTSGGNMSIGELKDWVARRDEFVIIDSYEIDVQAGDDGATRIWHADDHCEIELDESVVVLHHGGQYGSWDHFGNPTPDKTYEELARGRAVEVRGSYHVAQLQLDGLILRTFADAWSMSLDDLLGSITHKGAVHGEPVPIGHDKSGTPHGVKHVIWRGQRTTALRSTSGSE